jgi:type II secretory pathway pseudopilin PulG
MGFLNKLERLRSKDNRHGSQGGVTMVETLVACAILCILSLSMITLIITAIATNNRNKIDSTQTMLAESILEQIHSTFNGNGTSALEDCSGTTHTIDTTIPNTGSVGAALTGSTIDFTETTPPAGYQMDYVIRTPCNNTGDIVGIYDVRWHLDQIGRTNTYLITVSAKLKNHGEGNLFFALPVTLRFMAGS